MRRTTCPASRIAAAAVVASLALAGCADDAATRSDTTTLTVALFTDFGFQPLYRQYEQAHPDVRIKERIVEYTTHHKNLTEHLASGSGAADIEAVETGFINQMKDQPAGFVDLRRYGADALKDRWLPWKWQASLARTGEQIGYGTDVGGLAICYRRDLFEQAGLPTGRDEVSALWPTWDRYVEVGQRYMQHAPAGTAFYDGGIHLFNAVLAQAPVGYYDTGDNLVVDSNPAIRSAWDLVVKSIDAHESANVLTNEQAWDDGFTNSRFATVTCPAWMMGKIQNQARETAGKWDVALVPGRGGNWGGSYLTVPRQGGHARAAAELAAWLTAPEQQARVFTSHGSLPSIPELYDDPRIVDFRSEFFNNAPVGQIFTTAAKSLTPQYQGPHAGEAQIVFRDALLLVESGTKSSQQAWDEAQKGIAALGR